MKNRVGYLGWVNPGNLGDEALYKIDQAIFTKYDLELLQTKQFSANSTTEEEHSQITLIGGGTCIPKITFWMKPTKYIYIFGAGVEDPSFYGPFDPVSIARLKSFNLRLIGVRGNISKAMLKDWGIESEVIGDPCLSLKPREAESRDKTKIAINIGAAFSGGFWGSETRILNEVAKVCRALKKDGYELVLIPFWTNNLPLIGKLSRMENISIFDGWHDIEATLQLISTCKILIGEKLHSLVFSAAGYTPFICLGYAPEHFDFTESVGFSKYSIRTNEVTAEKIMALFDDLTNNYEKKQSELIKTVNEYREKQSKFAERIFNDIESLPENKWDARSSYGTRIFWDADKFLHRNMSSIWRVWNRLFFLRAMRHLA